MTIKIWNPYDCVEGEGLRVSGSYFPPYLPCQFWACVFYSFFFFFSVSNWNLIYIFFNFNIPTFWSLEIRSQVWTRGEWPGHWVSMYVHFLIFAIPGGLCWISWAKGLKFCYHQGNRNCGCHQDHSQESIYSLQWVAVSPPWFWICLLP